MHLSFILILIVYFYLVLITFYVSFIYFVVFSSSLSVLLFSLNCYVSICLLRDCLVICDLAVCWSSVDRQQVRGVLP